MVYGCAIYEFTAISSTAVPPHTCHGHKKEVNTVLKYSLGQAVVHGYGGVRPYLPPTSRFNGYGLSLVVHGYGGLPPERPVLRATERPTQ